MVDWLIARAKRTPYHHLDDYMMRWWLVPYRSVVKREIPNSALPGHERVYDEPLVVTDGTGPVSPWRRPFAWLLQRFDIAVRIHEILSSDAGRHPHSHPWSYLTILLRGKYAEERFDSFGQMIDYRIYGPGSILWRPAGSLHRLTLVGGPVTTLFITFKKRGSWGFHVNGKIVPHQEYKP